jgi:hypothetical protein
LCGIGTAQPIVERDLHLLSGCKSIAKVNLCDGGSGTMAGNCPISARSNLVVDWGGDVTDIYSTDIGNYLFGNSDFRGY